MVWALKRAKGELRVEDSWRRIKKNTRVWLLEDAIMVTVGTREHGFSRS